MSVSTILVEDSPTIRDNLVAALAELADAQVIGVADAAAQAVELLQSQPWTLVVVDLFLREGSGLAVLRACQERGPGQHALVLTNYPTPEMRRRCLALGADAVYDKSTELEDFFAHCRELAR